MSLPAADRAGVGTWGWPRHFSVGTLLVELIKDHPRPLGHPLQGNAPTGCACCVGPAGGFESVYQNLTILDAALDASSAM